VWRARAREDLLYILVTFGGLKTHLAKNDSAAFFGREKQQVEKDL